jgi:nucleoside-diphosphate-sugar epimerase
VRVAVFGASGGTGRLVVERLLADGHQVATLVRAPAKLMIDHPRLTVALAEAATDAGWSEVHPVALAGHVPTNRVMLYGPRDGDEVEVLLSLIAAAVRQAGGRAAGETVAVRGSRW